MLPQVKRARQPSFTVGEEKGHECRTPLQKNSQIKITVHHDVCIRVGRMGGIRERERKRERWKHVMKTHLKQRLHSLPFIVCTSLKAEMWGSIITWLREANSQPLSDTPRRDPPGCVYKLLPPDWFRQMPVNLLAPKSQVKCAVMELQKNCRCGCFRNLAKHIYEPINDAAVQCYGAVRVQ